MVRSRGRQFSLDKTNMTTAHQFIAAAFCLCGLLFLLHIDSVNSLRCKNCRFNDNDCNFGNVSETECPPNATCSLMRLFSPLEPKGDSTVRGCSWLGAHSYCLRLIGSLMQCFLFCSTDYCNNVTNFNSQ